MRVAAVLAAAVIGLVAGMLLTGTIAEVLGAGDGAREASTLIGALAGAVALGVWVARLVPAKPSRLRDRGVDRMRRR
jgi:hypothetical protein